MTKGPAMLVILTAVIAAATVDISVISDGPLARLPSQFGEGLLNPGFVLNVMLILIGWWQFRKLRARSEEQALSAARAPAGDA